MKNGFYFVLTLHSRLNSECTFDVVDNCCGEAMLLVVPLCSSTSFEQLY